MRPRLEAGVSLIEVMVVVAIVGLLMALGLPSFSAWIQNSQIRTAGESIVNGLQTAKNEAIRRNTCVQVQLIDTPLTSWEVRPCSFAAGDPAIASRSHAEGSLNASLEVTPGGTTTVSFNALGRVVNPNPSDGTPTFTQLEIRNANVVAAEERKLRIEIPPGGSIRMCDPHSGVAIGDPRRCN